MLDAGPLGSDEPDVYRRAKPSVMSRRPSPVHSSIAMSCERALT